MPEASLNKSFEKFWPELEAQLKAIEAMPGAAPTKLFPDEMVEDMHFILQELTPLISNISAEADETKNEDSQKRHGHAIANIPPGTTLDTSMYSAAPDGRYVRTPCLSAAAIYQFAADRVRT